MNISFTPLRGSICWWRNCEGAAHETREFLVCNGGSWRCPRVYGRDGRQLALFFQDVGVAWLGPRDAVNAGPKFHGKLGRVHAKGLNMIPSRHGTKRSAVSTHCTIPAGAAGQRQHTQCLGTQCHPLRCRTGLQVAGAALPVWQLAYRLHPDESLVQEGRPGPGIRATPAGWDNQGQASGGLDGQRHCQGAS